MSNIIPEEYEKQYNQNKEELVHLYKLSEEWKFSQEKEGVQVHLRNYKDNPVQMIRIETTFNATVNETADLLFNSSQELLNSKQQLQSAEVADELNEKGRVVLVTTKPLLFISSREILVYTNYESYENGIIQVQVGLDTHPKVPVNPSAVRTTTVLGGHLLLPHPEDPSKTIVIYIILNLLNGNIPAKLQSTVAIQHLNSYIYFKKYFEKKKADDTQK